MKRKSALIILCGIAAASAVFYGGMYMRSMSLIDEMLQKTGYPVAHVDGMRVYFDGIVIESAKLNDDVFLNNVYIQANPWQQFLHDPQFVSVGQAELNVKTLPQDEIGFPTEIPFTVDKIDLHVTTPLDKIGVTAQMKQNSSTSAMLYFKGKGENARLKGQAELYFEENRLKNINFDFSKIDLKYDVFGTKRADGWISFLYKDQWRVTGELGAGFADINGLQLADATVTINGTTENPSWSLTGKDRKTNESVSIEQNQSRLTTTFKNEQFQHDVQRPFSLDDFAAAEQDMRSIKPLQVVVVTKQRPKQKPQSKPETPQQKIPNDNANQFKIEQAAKEAFDHLVDESFFKGLRYSNGLTKIDVPCPQASDTGCWTARARGGFVTYDVNAVPPYFTRMKDYAASQGLRQVLQNLSVRTIAVDGKAGQAQQLNINGILPSGQPAYIELSVADVD